MSDKARIQAVYNARGLIIVIFFFFSSRRRHTRWTGDWSSDVSLPISVLPLLDGLARAEILRLGGVLAAHLEHAAGLLHALGHGLGLFDSVGHRLLHIDILAGVEREIGRASCRERV